MRANCRKCHNIITDPDMWNGSFNGCKPCRNIYLKHLRDTNPAYKLKAKARYRENAVHHRFTNKKLEVPGDWENIAKDKCEICGDRLDESSLRIDHSHSTGAFRGILCGRCNSGLGFFKDSPGILTSAAKYLRKV
jgi:hypothetical protein